MDPLQPLNTAPGGSGTQQNAGGTSSQQFYNPAPIDMGLDGASGNFRPGSPSSHLLRHTGSTDLPASSSAAAVVSGLVNAPPAARSVPDMVRQGVAATTHTFAAPASVSSTVQHPPGASTLSSADQAAIDRRITDELAEGRRKRDLEMQQLQQEVLQQQQQSQQQARQDYETQRRQQLQAAQEQEERAHQLRMQQIRASLSPITLPTSPALQQPSPLAAPMTPSYLHPPVQPAQLLPATTPPPHGTGMPAGISPLLPGLMAPPPPPPGGSSPVAGLDLSQLDAYFAQKMREMGHSPQLAANCNPFGASGAQVCGEKGRPVVSKVSNTDMAARFGVLAQPLFELEGNLENLADMHKMRKIMTPGYDSTGPGMVLRQARWPHKLLQTTTPGWQTAKHHDLTFHQLINGWLSVAMTETPQHKLDHELANKLSFAQYLVQMSFRYDHKDVLEASFDFIMSWQMKEIEWSQPWSVLKEKLDGIKTRFIQKDQPHIHSKKNPSNKFLNQGGGLGGAAADNPKKVKEPKSDINGVPKTYIKEKLICVRYNGFYGCKQKPNHENENAKGVFLAHICAGCFAKSNVKEAHPCHNCGQGPFGSLFR